DLPRARVTGSMAGEVTRAAGDREGRARVESDVVAGAGLVFPNKLFAPPLRAGGLRQLRGPPKDAGPFRPCDESVERGPNPVLRIRRLRGDVLVPGLLPGEPLDGKPLAPLADGAQSVPKRLDGGRPHG